MAPYFDYAATTPPHPFATQKLAQTMETHFANPSAMHSLGQQLQKEMAEHRAQIASALGAKSSEIYFTSSGTESNNWAIFGTARRRKKGHIITTSLEHNSVLEPCQALEREGFSVTYLAPDSTGQITPDQVVSALREDTILISVMLVNNETGQIFPVNDMVSAVRKAGCEATFHSDGVQGFLKIPFSLEEGDRLLKVDILTVSAHKVYGPKGIAALYIREGVSIPPLLYGGGQENGLRSGTESVPLIASFGTAVQEGSKAQEENCRKLKSVKLNVINGMKEIKYVKLLEKEECDYSPHILAISLVGYPSDVVVRVLSDLGIYVSGGSSCH
ncbi:MAG: cysteine desulfurase family protein, partial [Eubacteriales bacterium]